MPDLIDFESPDTKNIKFSLPSPLIPAPENLRNDGLNSNEAGPHNGESEKCRSTENNPFDIVMKKIIDYERNKEDPFETVIERANECNVKMPELQDNFSSQYAKYLDIEKMNNGLKETDINVDISLLKGENDMSIITDLNNTNLISDSIDENQVVSALSCENNIPNIYISPPKCNKNLPLLNNSSMNDFLIDHNINVTEEIKNLPTDFSTCLKSVSQNKNLLRVQNKRSMSLSDTLKSNIFGEDYLLNSAHSSIFEDPFNKAFRRNSLRSTVSYNSSYLSNQFDLSITKQNLERQISNSSAFSGLSNISVIPTDPVLKIKHNRFCSESSIFSGISNLSTISTNNFISSSDSSVFSNDTLNKGFINNKIQLTNSTTDHSPINSYDKSDSIKKFFEIKTKISTKEIEKSNIEDNKEQFQINHSCTKYNNSQIENKQNSDEKLIDIDSSFNSVFNDETEVNDIILNEARLLAETFEKMASSKESTSIAEDDLLSKIKLNFDYLPKSDDETVDNLIDLPASPLKNTLLPKVDVCTETHVEANIISLKDNIKALENEFIEKKSFNKKATTATLLLDLEKLIKEENNPDAYRVLNDLQKLLGIEYDNNTEILQLCLQNTENSSHDKNIDESHFHKNTDNSNYELNTSKQNIFGDRENGSYNSKENLENKQNNINISNLKLNIVNELKEKTTDNKNKINEFQHIKRVKDRKKEKRKENDGENLTEILITSLNQIINEKNENSAVDILRSLGTALSTAKELQTKKNDKQNSDLKKIKKYVPIKLHRLSNSFDQSSNSMNINTKNQSFKVLSSQKSMSTNQTYKNSNLLDFSFTKDKRRSDLLNLKKRFSSDPGFKNPVIEKNGNEGTVEQRFNFKTSGTTVKQFKTKFKKKFNSDIVTKKGPLKAVLSLDNMEKRESINQKIFLHNVTPPKPDDFVPTSNIVSSTPNTSEVNKNCKSEPTASSTPNVEGLKVQRTNVQKSPNLKSTIIRNVSSVLLNSNMKEHVGISVNCNKKMQRTLSPQKRSFTPKKTFESSLESRLPRYSPRPIRVRNYSFDDLKTAKSLQAMSNVSKFSSEKKPNRPIILSPLTNYNKFMHREKSVTRLGKPSNIQSDSEKENYG